MILSSSLNIFQDLDLVKLQNFVFLQNHHLITFNAYGNNFIEIHSLYIYIILGLNIPNIYYAERRRSIQ